MKKVNIFNTKYFSIEKKLITYFFVNAFFQKNQRIIWHTPIRHIGIDKQKTFVHVDIWIVDWSKKVAY